MNLEEGIISSTDLRVVPELHFCWFPTAAGNRPAEKELLKSTHVHAKARMLSTIERYVQGESRKKAVKPLGDGLWEFITQDSGIWLRVIFFTEHPHVVGVKTVEKKRNDTDPDDIEYTKRCRSTWSPEKCPGAFLFPGGGVA